ncbi:Ca2+-binding RTX toxin-like protein [Bradyrhizobium sp. AZCC 1578]|uniref:lipase family protein n=1 Tax=Bradyrhizobium sp. AZCC 1578 TaxID=3117027 RepID=UPI002FEEB17C
MTTYWVLFDYDMARSGQNSDPSLQTPVTFLGVPWYDRATQTTNWTPSFYDSIQPLYSTPPWMLQSLPYAAVTKGSWGPNGFTFSGNVVWNYTINIASYYVEGTAPDPTVKTGTVLTDTEFDDLYKYDYTVSWTDWAWATITIPDYSTLFTPLSDSVDFNSLTATQLAAIAGGANKYDALGASDTVILPNIANMGVSNFVQSTPFLGGAGNDTITGGDGNDNIVGGIGNDTIKASPGFDNLVGDDGNDTFDYQSGPFGGLLGFSPSVTTQTLNGGTDDGIAQDLIKLPGAPNDYNFHVLLGTSWALTSTSVESRPGSGLLPVSLTTREIERVRFQDQLDNVIAPATNSIAEMARLMVEVYDEISFEAQIRQWHPLAGLELGLRPSNFGVGSGAYTFINGIYEHVGGLTAQNDAVASVLAGVVGGKKTLTISFKGSDPTDLADWVHDITQIRTPFYEKYRPLVESLKSWLGENTFGIEQILVTGHSLGGGMTQMFVDELVRSGLGIPITAYTFGTIGGESGTVANAVGRITNFIHTEDIANQLNGGIGDPIFDGRGGSQVWINSSLPEIVNSWFKRAANHFKENYEADVLRLIDLAGDAGSPFHETKLAEALRDGKAWVGGDSWGTEIQIAPGTGTKDEIKSERNDNFVLAGGGNDSVSFGGLFGLLNQDLVARTERIIDGGTGTDRLLLPYLGSSFFQKAQKITAYGVAYDLTYTPIGGTAEAVGTLYRFEEIRYRNGIDYLDGRAANVQLPAPGRTQLNVDSSFDYMDAGDGDLLVKGTNLDDTIYLGSGNKTVDSGDGDDMVIAKLGGADNALARLISVVDGVVFIDSGFGNDILVGGLNGDTFFAGPGNDFVFGDAGNDVLVGNADVFATESDTFDGGDGDDTLYLEASDIVSGGSGRDLAYVINSNSFSIDLGATGIEWIQSDFGNDTIDGSSQTVGTEIYTDGGSDTITGSPFNDVIWSGSGDDVVNGGAGNDVIVGDIGADSISGGNGDDRLYVDASDMLIDGGTGTDAAYISGGPGMSINMATATLEWIADFVSGNDTIDGSNTSISLEVYAGGGTDTVIGGSGNDLLWAGGGNDTLIGNDGSDTLVGETASDKLTGGAGTDSLYGNSGNGGDGVADTFVFGDGWGTDFVFDFDHNVDKLDLTSVTGLTDFSQLTLTNTTDGHCYVTFSGNLIAVANMAGQLTTNDFFL